MERPNGEDGLVPETTAQFNNDYQGWFRQAKSFTEKEATDEKLLEREEGIKLSILNAAAKEAKEEQGGNAKGSSNASHLGKRILGRKLDKENREKRSSNNVMEIDDDIDITMGSGGGNGSSPGKRKSDEFDSILENDRDVKARRNE